MSANWLVSSPQFTRGKTVEAELDEIFRQQGFKIRQTTPEQERVECLGDRIFYKAGNSFYVEYKSGIQTGATGNIFLETISVDNPQSFRRGWLYTCRADYILYACFLNGVILVFKPEQLRLRIISLRNQFPQVKTSNNQNPNYNTHGLIIPLEWAKDNLAAKVIEVTPWTS